MMETIIELHRAPMEFAKVQLKQQANKDNGGNPQLALGQLESEVAMPATTPMVDASNAIDREEHHEDVLMDQTKQ